MSKEKKKNAQPATEEKPAPSNDEPTAAPENAAAQAPMPVLIEVPNIDPEMQKMATKWGIPLDKLVQMAEKINLFFADYAQFKGEVVKALPELPRQTIDLLKAEAEKQRAEMMQRAQSQPQAPAQGGGFDLGALGPLAQLLPVLLGGGSSNPLGDEITKKVIEAGISQMFAGTELLKAMQTRLLANMGAKAIEDALPK